MCALDDTQLNQLEEKKLFTGESWKQGLLIETPGRGC